MEDRGRRPEALVTLAVLLVISTLVAPTAGDTSHTTLFVTLPTPVWDAVPTIYPTTDAHTYITDQDSTEGGSTDTDSPSAAATTDPEVWEGGNEARSALLRLPSNNNQMTFLADDHSAASRIPDLMGVAAGVGAGVGVGGGGVVKGVGAGVGVGGGGVVKGVGPSLFPKTRTRPLKPQPGASPRRNTGRGDFMEAKPDLEVGSRHHYSSYPHRSPPPFLRRPPPALPPPHLSVIDKQDPLAHYLLKTNPLTRPFHNLTRVLNIEAECQDDFMRIHVQFNGSFTGLIYSSGYAYDGECIYVNGSGRMNYSFYIELNRCGTLNDNHKGVHNIRGRQPSKNTMWNTLTVQYNPLIEEVWDEHFKVTCEYGYDFWKTVTFPFLDVEVQTGNPVVFTLTPPECHMEIRNGLGTAGTRVTGPVRVGDPLTLVIFMRSEFEGFDLVVSDCFAHNGGNKRIALIDHYGCPVDESLISHFEGERTRDGAFQTQVYAFMKTFRFTGSPALYLECDVRMCHGDCPKQPCHWRYGKKKQKRSVRGEDEEEEKEDEKEEGQTETESAGKDVGVGRANMSESLSLFQSLQVVRDDQMLRSALRDAQAEKVCLEGGTVSAMASVVAVMVGLLTAACAVLCLRLRRNRKQQQQQHPPPLNTNFITTTPSSHRYRADFVPPTKRRLE